MLIFSYLLYYNMNAIIITCVTYTVVSSQSAYYHPAACGKVDCSSNNLRSHRAVEFRDHLRYRCCLRPAGTCVMPQHPAFLTCVFHRMMVR